MLSCVSLLRSVEAGMSDVAKKDRSDVRGDPWRRPLRQCPACGGSVHDRLRRQDCAPPRARCVLSPTWYLFFPKTTTTMPPVSSYWPARSSMSSMKTAKLSVNMTLFSG
eukprot:gnl/Ergobibamus_cyprinoides/4722.p2 GENE.gnl/Ergobibamus_cyprinoides/4722~~gnl/Ergobibamus_cyprinoides/4722.p2  ORF type:complete len:121 (+),score=1.14 gnl/Ergobibamus_cyprinoides/4722:39-365(+)